MKNGIIGLISLLLKIGKLVGVCKWPRSPPFDFLSVGDPFQSEFGNDWRVPVFQVQEQDFCRVVNEYEEQSNQAKKYQDGYSPVELLVNYYEVSVMLNCSSVKVVFGIVFARFDL